MREEVFVHFTLRLVLWAKSFAALRLGVLLFKLHHGFFIPIADKLIMPAKRLTLFVYQRRLVLRKPEGGTVSFAQYYGFVRYQI